MKTKKLQIGDIFEIKTELGLSYGQLTHRHPTHTDVLRIFRPKFKQRPHDVSLVTKQDVEFTVLCPVSFGFRTKTLERVGHAPVAPELQAFPKFRNSNRSPEHPEIDDWWIWDGEKETRVGTLSSEEMFYPRMNILNLVAIKELIEGRTHPAFL